MALVTTRTDKTSIEWETPRELFGLLDREFHFTLDAAATPQNAKCPRFFTKAEDGLAQSWADERVWLNPPFGRETPAWVEKAYQESQQSGAVVVCLIVPRTDTRWWHEYCSRAHEIRFLRGRVRFRNPDNPSDRPQDPSAVVVFQPIASEGGPWLRFWDWRSEVR